MATIETNDPATRKNKKLAADAANNSFGASSLPPTAPDNRLVGQVVGQAINDKVIGPVSALLNKSLQLGLPASMRAPAIAGAPAAATPAAPGNYPERSAVTNSVAPTVPYSAGADSAKANSLERNMSAAATPSVLDQVDPSSYAPNKPLTTDVGQANTNFIASMKAMPTNLPQSFAGGITGIKDANGRLSLSGTGDGSANAAYEKTPQYIGGMQRAQADREALAKIQSDNAISDAQLAIARANAPTQAGMTTFGEDLAAKGGSGQLVTRAQAEYNLRKKALAGAPQANPALPGLISQQTALLADRDAQAKNKIAAGAAGIQATAAGTENQLKQGKISEMNQLEALRQKIQAAAPGPERDALLKDFQIMSGKQPLQSKVVLEDFDTGQVDAMGAPVWRKRAINAETGQPITNAAATPKLSAADATAQAKAAIAAGASKDAVNSRLKELGHAPI